MRYFKYLAIALCLLSTSAAVTSCGDDDESTWGANSYQQGPRYTEFSAYVSCNDAKVNPFLYSLIEEESSLKTAITNTIDSALLKIEGVKRTYEDKLGYDESKEKQVLAEIKKVMTELEPKLKSMNKAMEGKITCSLSTSSVFSELIWKVEFDYPATSFKANDIIFYAINDKEAGVVENTEKYGSSNYTGDVDIPETVSYNGKVYTVTTIGPKAFYNSKITSIKLPKTITALYEECFVYTRQLSSITIPSGIKRYETGGTKSMFNGSGITEVIFEDGLTSLCGYMFEYNSKATESKLKKVTLPSSITEIPAHCFANCTALTDINVKGNITKIDEYAMYDSGIDDLAKLKLNNATLETYAFGGCTNLTTIDIPDGVTSIERSCFSGCTSATTVTIPASVKSMGINVFSNSKAITELHFKGEQPLTLTEQTDLQDRVYDTFTHLFETTNAKIFVPKNSIDTYKKAKIWSRYASYIQGE